MIERSRRDLMHISAATLASIGAASQVASTPRASVNHDGAVRSVGSRAELARLSTVLPGDVVVLCEAGLEGLFQCREDALPADADPLHGLHLPAAQRDWHFARLWDGIAGRPEWFGAVPDSPRHDCAAAIEACYALCPVTELAERDYHIARTLRLDRSWRTVRGVGGYATAVGEGTRIILSADAPHGATDDVVHVGGVARAVSEAAMVTEIHLSNCTLLRAARCAPHPSGDIGRYPTGLRVTFVLRCTFTAVAVLESSVGFHLAGVVYTKLDDCFARRREAGTGGGSDRWVGYYLNGHVSFGYAGGNASLYLNGCLAADQNPAHVDPVALLAKGAFVDSFIDRFESARIATGMRFAVDGARGYSQTIDLHVRSPVLDGCSAIGIDIDLDATSSASIEILDPYIAAGGVGDAGIAVHDGAGLTTITGGQIHGDFRRGSIFLDRTFGVRVSGTKIHNSRRPVVVGEAGGLVLEPQILNYQHSSDSFAVDCARLTRSVVRPVILGASGPAFRGGVRLGSGCRFCEVGTSTIDPNCFTVPDPRFILWFGDADARGGPALAAFERLGNRQTGAIG